MGSNHGDFVGGNTDVKSRPGKLGSALDFDGSGDWVIVSDDDSLSFGDASNDEPFSMTIWANMDDASNFRFVSKGSTGSREYYLAFASDDEFIGNLYDDTSSHYEGQSADGNPSTADEGTWVFWVVTYNGVGGSGAGAGMNVYRNTAVHTTADVGGGTYVAMHNHAEAFYIGSIFALNSGNGQLDDVRMYDKVLSAIEIEDLYYGGDGTTNHIAITGGDLTFYSSIEDLDAVYTTGWIRLEAEETDSITLNTDVVVSLSNDAGSTWDAVTMAVDTDAEPADEDNVYWIGEVTLTGGGTQLMYRVVGANNKNYNLHGCVLGYK
jgi:hypothetical protein